MKGEKEAPAPEASEPDQKPSEPAAGDGEAGKEGNEEDVPPGIPEFWLNVLRNYEEIGNRVCGLPTPSLPFQDLTANHSFLLSFFQFKQLNKSGLSTAARARAAPRL